MKISQVKYLCTGVKVADGVGLEVALVFAAEHSRDDYDDDGHHANGGQNCSDDPQVAGWVLNHSCKIWGRTEKQISISVF